MQKSSQLTVAGTEVPLQQAMIRHQLGYWHRLEAMWLILGVYAMAGCIGAVVLRRWLTQGCRRLGRPAPSCGQTVALLRSEV